MNGKSVRVGACLLVGDSDIIRDYYFIEDKMDDADIQVELNIGRTFYYRMKKAAITLFGILLWNIVVEECIKKTA